MVEKVRQNMNMDNLIETKSSLDPMKTYVEAILDFYATLNSLTAEQWSLPTPCPGWTVADIVAHTIDLDSLAVGNPPPAHEPNWDELPHAKDPFQQFTERGVDYRRGTPPAVLLQQMLTNANNLTDFLAKDSPELTVPWVDGEISQKQFLGMRTFDIWTHNLDVRIAVGLPGEFTSNPAKNAAGRMLKALPFIWGKKIGAPHGESLQINFTGEDFGGTVCIATDADGKAAFTAEATGEVTHIEISWADFVNGFCGRVDPEVTRARIIGSGPRVQDFVNSLSSTP
jgi:uncharacterized protein (TIGR03083 family)